MKSCFDPLPGFMAQMNIDALCKLAFPESKCLANEFDLAQIKAARLARNKVKLHDDAFADTRRAVK